MLDLTMRATIARDRALSLLALDFVSSAPRALANAIARVCTYLASAAEVVFAQIDWTDPDSLDADVRVLRQTDTLVQQLAAHLRYVQGARTERLPWGIVSALEGLVRQLLPNVQVMLRPKWNYNYSLNLADFRAAYLEQLEEYADYLPALDLERDVLRDLLQPFHVMSFPSLERENILLHTLLGHEIGHLFADQFLSPERQSLFLTQIVADIERVTDEELKQSGVTEEQYGPLFFPEIRRISAARNTDLAFSYWVRALEELISDLVGVLLFGPAALFSTVQMALQDDLDVLPEPKNSFYPPWRLRLREVLGTIEEIGPFFPIPVEVFPDSIGATGAERAKRLNDRYEHLRRLVGKQDDVELVGSRPIAKLAYSHLKAHLIAARQFLLERRELAKAQVKPRRLFRYMRTLVERLDHDIPPNALERTIDDRRTIGLVEIINAAWLHRISLEAPSDETLAQAIVRRARADRLTLKAIEYADLAKDYWLRVRPAAYRNER